MYMCLIWWNIESYKEEGGKEYLFIPERSQRWSWMIGFTEIENPSRRPSSSRFLSISLSLFIEHTSSSHIGKRMKSLSLVAFWGKIFSSWRRSFVMYSAKTWSKLRSVPLAVVFPRTIFLMRSAKGRARPRDRLNGLALIIRLSSKIVWQLSSLLSVLVLVLTYLQYFYEDWLF